ncbi:hypothetical protein [Streptomyces sp. NPDC000994]
MPCARGRGPSRAPSSITSPDDTRAAIAGDPTAAGVPVRAEKPSATRLPTV